MNENQLLEEWKKTDPLLTDINGYNKFLEQHRSKQQLVKQYLENEQKIKKIQEQQQERKKQAQQKVRQVENKYYDKAKAIKKVRDDEIALIWEQEDSKTKEEEQKRFDLSKVIAKVDRIIAFLKLQTKLKQKDLTIKDEDVKAYHDRHIESLGYFFDDTYLKIKLFIAENDKPKNKYSLIALGKCLFEGFMNLREYRSYGADVQYHGNNITVVIKEGPDITELKLYLERRRKKLLIDLLETYKQVKEQYESVLAEHEIGDFEPLIEYCCLNCGFFLTKRELNHWGRVGDKCPECGEKTLVKNDGKGRTLSRMEKT